MQNMCIASAKTLTIAQMAKKSLAREGIYASVVSIDPKLTEKGCAYGVSFRCSDRDRVRDILASDRVPYGQIIVG